MNNICITHITTVHPIFDTRIFYKECKSLAKCGFTINLIVSHDKEETIEGVHVIPLPFFKGRPARMFLKPLLAFFAALKTKADLYHFHDPELLPIGMLLKLLGKKVVYDAHEDVPSQILSKYWIPLYLRRFVSLVIKGVESFCCRFFDGIITATPHIRSKLLTKNKNTIDINNYPILEEFTKLNEKTDKEKIICYIGGITKERGIVELLKAIEGTDITLYLAGTATPKSLIKNLEQTKGWKNVVYFGQVTREKVSSILSNSAAGVVLFHPLDNHLQSLPNKLFEYMGAGLPVLASNFPYWKKLLQSTDNAYFADPLNPEDIRTTINSLLSDKEKSYSMGIRGLTAVQEIYNWGKEEKKFIDFYKTLGVYTTI